MQETVLIPRSELEAMLNHALEKAVQRKHVPSVMTKAQLCEYVDKPRSTIEKWMREGLPYRKEGKDYPEFYKPQVDKWLEQRFSNVQESEVVQ